MSEEINMSDVIDEVKNATEEELRDVIKRWFDSTRTDGLKIGAYLISAAVFEAIEKNLTKGSNSSLRDYQRAIKRIIEIVSVQLKQEHTLQNDLEETMEDITNDGTAE